MNIVEPVSIALNVAGKDLVFSPTVTIKGIPNIDLMKLLGEVSDVEMDKQEFSFRCSLADIKGNSITEGTEFVFDGNSLYSYTFEIDSIMIDLSLWSTLNVSYVSKAAK